MKLYEIYTVLHNAGYVLTQDDFSKNWLGRSKNYLAYLKNTEKDASIETLLRLRIHLMKENEVETRWNIGTGVLTDLAERTTEAINNRIIA